MISIAQNIPGLPKWQVSMMMLMCVGIVHCVDAKLEEDVYMSKTLLPCPEEAIHLGI
jgi:hypothetical protein